MTEAAIAKERGLRLHPMSGAGRIKQDASDREQLVEVKDANRSYTVKASDVKSLHHEASIQGKEPVLVVVFTNGYEVEAVIRRRSR